MRIELVGVIIISVLLLAYLGAEMLKKKHYTMIDEIKARKQPLLTHHIPDEFEQTKEIKLAGLSKDTYETLFKRWQEIEANDFPTMERLLAQAEEDTSKYRFSQATENETMVRNMLEKTEVEIEEIAHSLSELMENQEKNREKSTKVEEEYQELRNKLLTHSFTYGSALEALEMQVSDMEQDFTEFQKATEDHDYVGAQSILDRINEKTNRLREETERVPALFDLIEEEIIPQLKELEETSTTMVDSGHDFPNGFILEEIKQLKKDTDQTVELISQLHTTQAQSQLTNVSNQIEKLYTSMEEEFQAKKFVSESTEEIKSAFDYLFEKNRRIRIETDRLNQSYVLTKEEKRRGEEYHEFLDKLKTKFDFVSEELTADATIYSNVQQNYREIMSDLESLYSDQDTFQKELNSLKTREEVAEQDILACNNQLNLIRRHLEMQSLPGLPDNFVELYFQTTERMSKIENEMNKNKIDIHQIEDMLLLAKEDVSQVKEEAEEILTQVALIEQSIQHLNRYRKEYPSISDVINESKAMFHDRYDYETSLRLVSEKLDEIEPGTSTRIQKQHQKEKEENQ